MAKRKQSKNQSRRSPKQRTASRESKPAQANKTQGTRSAKAKTGVRSRKSGKLTLPDRLSRLTYISACQLLGDQGKELMPFIKLGRGTPCKRPC